MRLHINIDHVATLRNARGTSYPDPVALALLCENAGADGITAHLREDRRHIRDSDIQLLRRDIKTRLNLEMASTQEMANIAARVHPDAITLVPERREERTTEGGLDVLVNHADIAAVAAMCERENIKLSLFIVADEAQVRQSSALGAAQIELHTGEYCHRTGQARDDELDRLRRCAQLAAELGLEVAAGHGLTLENLGHVVAIPQVQELNIGHAVISDALILGIAESVRAYRRAVSSGMALRSTLPNPD